MDLISRQAAIDALHTRFRDGFDGDKWWNSTHVLAAIEGLPPAQPEPQEGHWIPHESPDGGEQYECSRCGVLWEFNDGTPEDNEAYFCPKCGKKLITK